MIWPKKKKKKKKEKEEKRQWINPSQIHADLFIE